MSYTYNFKDRECRALDQLFKDAVNRKPIRLFFDTTNSRDNIYDWLQTILTDWTQDYNSGQFLFGICVIQLACDWIYSKR